jgi:hypothetical protein
VNAVLVVGRGPDQSNALAERLGLLGVEAIPCARDWKLAVRSLMAHDVSLILFDVDNSEDSLAFFRILAEVSDVPVIARGVMANTDNVISYRTGASLLRLRSERSRLTSEAARS